MSEAHRRLAEKQAARAAERSRKSLSGKRPWVVVVRPDATHIVRVVGPFASQERAVKVRQTIEDVDRLYQEEHDVERMADLIPQAVELENLAAFLADLRAGDV